MKEAFVYIWTNKVSGRKYIGYHKGREDDGYVCSSSSSEFWSDYNDPTALFEREILHEGTADECLKEEQRLLRGLDLMSDEYYNNARGAEIIFTQEVLSKMSKSAKRRWKGTTDYDRKVRNLKIAKSKKGKPQPAHVKKTLSELYIGRSFVDRFGVEEAAKIGEKIRSANLGKKIHSHKNKKKLSKRMTGNNFGALQSDETKAIKRERFLGEGNPGKNKSEETKRRISKAKLGKASKSKGVPTLRAECPHCHKIGGVGVMHRWHFQNCKLYGKEK